MNEYIMEIPDYPSKVVQDGWNVRIEWEYKQREKIVRCRDCYFADEIEGGYWCDRFDCGKEHVTPNGFCAWGERRE